MKHIRLFFLFTLLTLLSVSSCDTLKDNLDDCGMYVNLYFEYLKFPERIHKVNVGIIGEDGRFYRVRDLNKRNLDDYQGVRTRLMPGRYMAVCWGNNFDETRLEGLDFRLPANEHFLYHRTHGTTDSIVTNDSLFYGRLTFDIPFERGVYDDTIHYRPAHITFEISVFGLESMLPGAPAENYPQITIENLKPYYDHEMDTRGDYVTYYPDVEIDTEKVFAFARTHVLRFVNDNPIQIVVDEPIAATHAEIPYTIELKKLLHGRLEMIHEDREYIIKIGIFFNSLGVDAKLLGWVEQGTEVEL